MVRRRHFTQVEREQVSEKIMDLGNIAAGALIFGQAFSGFPFDLRVAFTGLFTLACLYGFALFLMLGGENR